MAAYLVATVKDLWVLMMLNSFLNSSNLGGNTCTQANTHADRHTHIHTITEFC